MSFIDSRSSLEKTCPLVPAFPEIRQYFSPLPRRTGSVQSCTPYTELPLIRAHANSAPEELVPMIPGLAEIHARSREVGAMRYGDPECPVLKGAIAGFMRVPAEAVVVTASTLQAIERLPAVTGCTSVICLYGDFAGYARACQLHKLPLTVVSAQPGRMKDLHEHVALAVRDAERPLVLLSAGFTNPLQTQITTSRMIEWILEANPFAVIVIDTAYGDYGDMDQGYYAHLALERRNVIALVPASKVLLHAGLAAGWMVIGDETLRAKVRASALPYPMSGIATAILPDLLQAEYLIRQMRAIMMDAGKALVSRLRALDLGERMIEGKAPWLMLDMGEAAGEVVIALEAERILIQRQSGTGPSLSRNWLRISYTVPAHVDRIADAIARSR